MSFFEAILPVISTPLAAPSSYRDRSYEGTDEEYRNVIQSTCTLYVGNLSFYTTEEQIYEFFGRIAAIKKVIMGLDRAMKTPCGFCFIEYYCHDDAVTCKKYLDGMKIDERFIRIDFDHGFKDGRQYGRGRKGGQVACSLCRFGMNSAMIMILVEEDGVGVQIIYKILIAVNLSIQAPDFPLSRKRCAISFLIQIKQHGFCLQA